MSDGATISSPANPRIKAAVALRDRSERDQRGQTLVDGARELARAMAAGVEVVEAFVEDDGDAPDVAACRTALEERNVAVAVVGRTALDRLAFGQRSPGVVAVVRTPSVDLARLAVDGDPLIVVLQSIEKPGNLGAVLRSADAVGAAAVIVADPTTDPFNPNVIRASIGTVFAVRVAVATSADVREWLTASGIRPVVARVDADRTYTDVDLRGPVALVLGAEVGGPSDAWAGPDVEAVSIPMHGVADSLNVSVSAAVLLHEARRQRDAARP